MAARRIIVPDCMPSRDANGRALPAKLRFYQPDTAYTAPAVVYLDDDLTTPAAWPLLSDADGLFPTLWADSASVFDVAWSDVEFERPLGAFSGVTPITPAASKDEIDAAAAAAAGSAEDAGVSAGVASASAIDAAGSATTATTQAGYAVNSATVAMDAEAAAETALAGTSALLTAQTNLIQAVGSEVVLKMPDGTAYARVTSNVPKFQAVAIDYSAAEMSFIVLWEGPGGEILAKASKVDGSIDLKPGASLIDQVTSYVRPLAEDASAKTARFSATTEMNAIREPVYDDAGNLASWIDARGYYNFYGLKVATFDPATLAVVRNALVLPNDVLGRGEPGDVDISLNVTPSMVDRIGPSAVRFLAPVGGTLRAFQTRRDVSTPGAMIEEATGPIQVVIALGDSKSAGGAGSSMGDAVQNLAAPFSYQALMLTYPGIRSTPGEFVFDPNAANDIVAGHEEAAPGETQGCGSMRWLIDRETAAGERKVTRAYYSAGKSGQALAGLISGSQPYINAMLWLEKFVAIAARYGRTVEVDFFLKEGTNDQKQRDRASVLSLMTAQRATLMTDAVARTGQSRPSRFYVSVTEATADNRSGSAAPNNINEIAIGQQLFAEAFSNVYLTTCPYWFTGDCGFADEVGGTDLHNRNPGYVLDGECMAEAIRMVGAGGVWTNHRVKAITRSAAVIDVEVYTDNLTGPLVLDTSTRANAGNYGFAVYDQAGVELTISSVAIVSGQFKYRITLSVDPGTAVDVTYAYKVGAGAALMAGTWGNCRDSAAIASNVASVATRAHWLLPFFKRTAT
jgi:hypothetical protein